MPIDWLSYAKLGQSALVSGVSTYRALIRRTPRLHPEIQTAALKLRIENPRAETVLIENVEATPPLIGFMLRDSIADAARAFTAREHRPPDPLLVLNGHENASVKIVTFDPFEASENSILITITAHWRSAHRGLLSRGRSKVKVRVGDVRQLRAEAERRQPVFVA